MVEIPELDNKSVIDVMIYDGPGPLLDWLELKPLSAQNSKNQIDKKISLRPLNLKPWWWFNFKKKVFFRWFPLSRFLAKTVGVITFRLNLLTYVNKCR